MIPTETSTISPPFPKGGRGDLATLAEAGTPANPPQPPFGKGGSQVGIPADVLTAIADAAATLPALDDAGMEQLRAGWPGLRLTLCSDNDIPARLPAVLERPGFNLYLVNGSGVVSASALTNPASPLRGGSEHCLTLTNDPEAAIGVVLAWVEED